MEYTHSWDFQKKSKNIGIIHRIAYLLPPHVLKTLYFTLIHPYLSYCNLIWTSTYDTHLTKLNRLQKKAIRIITKSPFNAHTSPLYQQLNVLKISQIKFIQTSTFMYKYDNNLLPLAFSSYFRPNLYTKGIRNNRAYISVFAKTNTRKFSIKYQGPLLWNNIPESIRASRSLAQFKIQIRAYTLNNVKWTPLFNQCSCLLLCFWYMFWGKVSRCFCSFAFKAPPLIN